MAFSMGMGTLELFMHLVKSIVMFVKSKSKTPKNENCSNHFELMSSNMNG